MDFVYLKGIICDYFWGEHSHVDDMLTSRSPHGDLLRDIWQPTKIGKVNVIIKEQIEATDKVLIFVCKKGR